MSHAFVSCKSEDMERVARLANALERCGLDVWWDRYLRGGENWHAQIQTALETAKCVVVVWTRASVGPAGDFVRDEARAGKQRFPDGAYRSQAQSLLADRHVVETKSWKPAVRPLRLAVAGGERGFANNDRAKADALARAQHQAEALCSGFAATTLYRFKSAKPEAEQWDCSTVGSGISCGFDGQTICRLDVKETREEETCGK
jgi:hypothetical protein